MVYVMTTNKVELLDPALIRPGRITYSLELKELNYEELHEMLMFYYVDKNIHNEKMDTRLRVQYINEIAKTYANKANPSTVENICNNYNLSHVYNNINDIFS